jgi:hypothetical protein
MAVAALAEARDAPPAPSAAPSPSAAAEPAPSPVQASPVPVQASPAPAELPTPAPLATPTQPPIVLDPAQPLVEIGHTFLARINSALGNVVATVADQTIVGAVVDQQQRALYITGRAIGTTTITLRDDRGVTLDVVVRVEYAAGTIPDDVNLRVTGDPASSAFLRDAIAEAVTRAATLRPGARVVVYTDTMNVRNDLALDDRTQANVQLVLQGDNLISVSGTTRVHIENVALPRARPARLLVSDYPETLTADGVLFTSDVDANAAQRFLYYHYNPPNQPPRRVLVKITNSSGVPATLHVLSALAGPGNNELEVGHNATKAFLVRDRRNEGTVVTVPPNATINLVNHPLPASAVVNGILQVREVAGFPLSLAVVAQPADAPLDQSVDTTQLLSGGAPHARGIYPVPDFFADYTYVANADDLEIPVGTLPLPNLRQGEALAGDYGVKLAARIVLINTDRVPHGVAVYANPRGGGATGTFLIDNTLVQAHRLPPFSKYKIWQETIPPGTYRRLRIVTMAEGGSSYPMRLIVGPDDGSVAPGAPSSPIY